jgi:hypothetical protein
MRPVTPLRIAMWSGPRNISTAMMRSWGQRPDTTVSDEPLYGYYLAKTGIDHPMAREVMASMETDWRCAAKQLTGPVPGNASIWYQKHMTHHLLPEVGLDWLDDLTHVFLVRDPTRVLASYVAKRESVTLDDLGFRQQAEIFDRVGRSTGATPPVLDAQDVLENPRRLLGLLCDALGVSFADEMLAWPAGPRDTDGVWARHWYAKVEASTGFGPPRRDAVALPEEFRPLAEECEPYYRRLWEGRLGGVSHAGAASK